MMRLALHEKRILFDGENTWVGFSALHQGANNSSPTLQQTLLF
jgi:hypothetical protein